MIQTWRKMFQLPQTRYLLIGVGLGYLSFIFWLGIRLLVLISGAVIALLAIAIWYLQLQPQKNSSALSANLLQAEVFLSHLNLLNNQIPTTSKSHLQFVQKQAQTIQQLATDIAQQESALIPDLLETLHTVLDLVAQLVQALQVRKQIKTPHYQELAQQQLQSSLNRLQQTCQKLQELHDQLALDGLERRTFNTTHVLSTRLQLLIAENERWILENR